MAICCLLARELPAQAFDARDLAGMLEQSRPKLEVQLSKKGFRKTGLDLPLTFTKVVRKDSTEIVRTIRIAETSPEASLEYQTSSEDEFRQLQNQLQKEGFRYAAEASPQLYQKNNLTVRCQQQKKDDRTFYCLQLQQQQLPRAKDVLFAEDLLQLKAEAHLVTVFGQENVKTESISFSEAVTRRCSILFPNTSRQAVFVWNDEVNLREVSLVIIGEQVGSSTQSMKLPDWRSRQGVYCGMSLQEIQRMNGEAVRFYNWHTESAGCLTPQNKGALDFERVKTVFSCLNCDNQPSRNNAVIINSQDALGDQQKVYVSTLLLFPEKKTASAKSF